MKKYVLTLLTGLILFAPLSKVLAIPAFARKYKTSCVTCHTVYPKLNSFGVAFKLNGYLFPEGDAEQVKEDPVILVAETYKSVWPKSIWPGSIPGTTPIAFRLNQAFSYDAANSATPTKFTVPSAQMFMGGTFNERISFFVSLLLAKGHNTNALQMAYIRLNDLFSSALSENALNLRIGQFIPDITNYKNQHNSLTDALYAINTYVPSKGSSLALSHRNFGIMGQVIGVEANGLITKRMRYALGLSNGNAVFGEDNKAKDFYGKIAYKFGGMAFDGSYTGNIFGPSGNNWTEKSILVSGFAYSASRFNAAEKEVSLYRFGGDINVNYRDLNVIGGYLFGVDEDFYVPTGRAGNVKFNRKYNLFFSEANYMMYPWLAGTLRYEWVKPQDIHNGLNDYEFFNSGSRYILNVTALYTANLKFFVETKMINDIDYEANILVGIDYAF
ncbi:MAG: hypothetical protein DRI75_11125 [Bacteroidetes bacterium]|nr:MAG: hypothetical protein DRI75_11125 [Bacteroidota bacterium]